MTQRPFHISTVFFHLEGTLATPHGRGLRAAVQAPAVRAALALLRDKGLGTGVLSRHSLKAVRRFLTQAFRMRPADLRSLIWIEDSGPRGRRRNPFQAAAQTTGCVPERVLVV